MGGSSATLAAHSQGQPQGKASSSAGDGAAAICRFDQRGSLVNAVREQRRVDLARALQRKEGTVGRNSTASASASLRASAAACMCAARKKALALYHERTLAIMTGEPRVCTLACTPGATKALADAHARRTRRDLNISTAISRTIPAPAIGGVKHTDGLNSQCTSSNLLLREKNAQPVV